MKSHHFKSIIPAIYFLFSIAYFVWISSFSNLGLRHFIGMAITVFAFILWLTARWQLGEAFSVAPKATNLVTTGIYSKLRHPIYYFSILAVIGLSLVIWNMFVFVIVGALIFLEVYRINKEEKLLQSSFGEKYSKYKKETWF